MPGTAVALTEKPVLEVPLPLPVGISFPIHLTRPAAQYTAPYEEMSARLGADLLWVVEETESRLTPSSHALEHALRLARETSARWFVCAHTSTLGTTDSEVAYASALIRQAGAELLYLVPPAPRACPPAGRSAVAARLEEHRAWCGWSSDSLGDILGLSPTSICAILSGEAAPSPAEVEAWAGCLGLAPGWLEGRPCFKWGAEVLRLRRLLREQPLTGSHDAGPDAPLRRILRFAEANSGLCQGAWFLPGILGLSWWEYQRFLRFPIPAGGAARERLSSVLDLPLRHLHGDCARSAADSAAESLSYSISLGRREGRR